LRHYQSRHAGVEVQLVEGGAAVQPDRLARGEVHLAIMPAGDDRWDGRLLYPVYVLAVLSDMHRLKSRSVLDVADLVDEPILVLRREFGSRRWFDAACEMAHLRPRIRLESGAPQTLIELATAGYGIAVVPSTVVIRKNDLRAVPLVQGKTSLGRWSMVGWDPQRVLPPYAQQFVNELVVHTRRGQPGGKLTRRAPSLPPPKKALG
jgi:LysR family transcriptional regulator, cyn operon transcriptional activator